MTISSLLVVLTRGAFPHNTLTAWDFQPCLGAFWIVRAGVAVLLASSSRDNDAVEHPNTQDSPPCPTMTCLKCQHVVTEKPCLLIRISKVFLVVAIWSSQSLLLCLQTLPSSCYIIIYLTNKQVMYYSDGF